MSNSLVPGVGEQANQLLNGVESAKVEEQAENTNAIISSLMENFGPELVYEYSHYFATYIASWLSPLLLLLAIVYAIAINQFQLITSSQGRTAEVLYNAIFYGLVLSLYFMLGFYAFEWFNALYGIGGESGDLKALTTEMDRLYSIVQDRDESFMGWGDIFKLPAFLVVWGFYYASYLFLVAMIIMMRFAHAALFGVVYVWGTIAIPLSASMAWAPVGNWAMMFTFVLLWPFVEGLMIMLISGMFTLGLERSFVETPDATQVSALFSYFSVFSVLNVVLIAVVVSAPAVTSILLVRNEALGRALVPYMAAGLAIGKFFTDIARSRTMGVTNKSIDRTLGGVAGGLAAGAALGSGVLGGGSGGEGAGSHVAASEGGAPSQKNSSPNSNGNNLEKDINRQSQYEQEDNYQGMDDQSVEESQDSNE